MHSFACKSPVAIHTYIHILYYKGQICTNVANYSYVLHSYSYVIGRGTNFLHKMTSSNKILVTIKYIVTSYYSRLLSNRLDWS